MKDLGLQTTFERFDGITNKSDTEYNLEMVPFL